MKEGSTLHRKPNFLMLVADQHRADCLGCAGQFPVKTPHLDRLAERGVRFENAFTPLPVCAPARQAMLCGENPDSYGAFWNFGFFAAASLSPKGYWPEALANSGYQTAFLGKWSASEDFGPTDFGYQTFVSMQDYEAFCREKYPNRKRPNWFGDTSELPLEHSKTHFLAGHAAVSSRNLQNRMHPGIFVWTIRIPICPVSPASPLPQCTIRRTFRLGQG
jgi:arylsulfatase A-like enzyme